MGTIGDAPQGDRLDFVRRIVAAARDGAVSGSELGAKAGVAPRYALYCLQSARQLGLVTQSGEGLAVGEFGQRLLATAEGSSAEREVYRSALRGSAQIGDLARFVLEQDEPARDDVTEYLERSRGMSRVTAQRRASTLTAWRRYLAVDRLAEPPPLPFPGFDLEEMPLPAVVPPAIESAVDAAASPPPPASGGAAAVSASTAAGPSSAPPAAPATAASAAPKVAAPPNAGDLAYLARQLEQGALILFTGAGFSLGANDVKGRRLPTGAGFAEELWNLCYPGETQDASTLQDLFETAVRRNRGELQRLLATRFAVDAASLPAWYETWFSMPWARIYTLNVDDLASAAARKFTLPRTMRAVSALITTHGANPRPELDVIHLNGIAVDGIHQVTFSVDQYSQRLARDEPHYSQLAAELIARPFVFVGTVLDEPLLWSHIELRGQRAEASGELRPKSILITPSISRAREDKLRAYNVVCIKTTAAEFASEVLATFEDSRRRGLQRLAAMRGVDQGDERNIQELRDLPLDSLPGGEFLLGEEPTWGDLRTGRAVTRDEDAPRIQNIRRVCADAASPSTKAAIFALSGTAGAGKTTFLMRLALQLHSDGIRVAWVGASAEVAPGVLTRFYGSVDRPPVLLIDDAGRYGRELVPILRSLVKSDELAVIVLGLRSYHEALLEVPSADDLEVRRDAIGPLTDGDIGRVIDALEHEKRLGALRGLTPAARVAAFRERAERQILVAMIEATSGERFEDRVLHEWQNQAGAAKYVYALVSLATANSYAMSRDEVLLSCGGKSEEMAAMAKLVRARLLVEVDGRLRTRHRVIAERLVDELAQRGEQLEKLILGLCRALAIKGGADAGRNSRRKRVLKRLLQHDTLYRLLGELEPARSIYRELEAHLDADHHFWLQRGCLELECGDVRYAENFLDQAAALNNADPLVLTAQAHMRLRKAVANPTAPGADALAVGAFDDLRRLLQAREARDYHPAHVFGSQAIGWSRSASLTPRARKALLREASEIVERALRYHRSRHELRELSASLKRELLTPM